MCYRKDHHFWRSVCSCCQTTYCGTSCLLCCWRACLEHSSCRHHFSTFLTHFLKAFKTAPLPILLSRLCPLNSLFTPFMVLVVAVCYLGHVKIFFDYWLIDAPTKVNKQPPKITWLSVDSIQPDVMVVAVERTFSPQNFSMFPSE